MTPAHPPRLAIADDQLCGIVQLDPSEDCLRALSLPDFSDPSQRPFAIADAAARQAAISTLPQESSEVPVVREDAREMLIFEDSYNLLTTTFPTAVSDAHLIQLLIETVRSGHK